jgi:hypothetical protein
MHTNCTPACLFDLFADENEHHELTRSSTSNSSAVAAKVKELMSMLEAIEQTAWTPDRGKPSQVACDTANGRYGGTYGPFVGLD